VTGSDGTCSATDNITVTVNPLPVVSVSPLNPTICAGETIALTASGANSYTWSPATGLSGANIPDPDANPVTTTAYTITGTTNGCSNVTTVTVTVDPVPVISVSAAADSVCAGQSTQLNASGAGNYTWSPTAGLSDDDISNPVSTPAVTTTYTVTGTTGACSGQNTITIAVNPAPDADALINQETCTGANDASIDLSVTGASAPYTYLWSNGSSTEDISGLSPNTYTVSVTDTKGCTTTQDVDIDASAESCYEPHLYLPNIFSPNNDGDNDVFYARGQGIVYFEINIYNRWGQKVFESTDLSNGWDGTLNGQVLDPAVFVYYVRVEFTDGTIEKRNGNLTLVR
jgi:gliding motility-associated-like protein